MAITTVGLESVEDPTPWASVQLPDPLAAELAASFGGPLAVEAICLYLGDQIGVADVEPWVSDAFEMLSVDVTVVEVGELFEPRCRVAVDISLVAERTPATYRGTTNNITRTCWNGWTLHGAMAVWRAGNVTGVNDIDDSNPTPGVVGLLCDAQNDDVYEMSALRDALRSAFGYPAALAVSAAWEVSMLEDDDLLLTVRALEAVLAGAFHADARVRTVTDLALAERFVGLESLTEPEVAAIPTMIAALAHHRDRGFATEALVEALAGALAAYRGTDDLPDGFATECPADWWLLFQGTWAATSCDVIGAP